jgi:hypothetical protein
VLLVAALFGGLAPAASADDPACALGDQPVSKLSEFGAQFVTICLLNQQRAAHGLSALTFNRKLALAGGAYADRMIAGDFFSHTGPDGDTAADRVQLQGYADPGDEWEVGETLAWGEMAMGTPRAIVTGWMASAPHSAVILNPDLHEVGIGVRLGAPVSPAPPGETATYAAEFGTRTPAAPQESSTLAPRAATLAPWTMRRHESAATCRKHARTKKQRSRCAGAARARG